METKKKVKKYKDIPEFHGIYAISKSGEVLNRYSGKKAFGSITHKGYLRIRLNYMGGRYAYRINRLVALTYIPNPLNLPDVGHKDGNKLNNWDWNLEWCTQSQNTQHAYDNGLSVANRRAIKQLSLSGELIKEWESAKLAGSTLDISFKNICQVARKLRPSAGGYGWEYITKRESDPKTFGPRLLRYNSIRNVEDVKA